MAAGSAALSALFAVAAAGSRGGRGAGRGGDSLGVARSFSFPDAGRDGAGELGGVTFGAGCNAFSSALSGTVITAWHFGQRPRFPAAASGAEIFLPHWPQLNEMLIARRSAAKSRQEKILLVRLNPHKEDITIANR
jgi:hypothetical protein